MQRRRVVECDFFAGSNRPQGKKIDPAGDDPGKTIRIAGMIDARCRAARAVGVNAPPSVDLADADLATAGDAGSSFPRGDLFPDELANLLARRNWGAGKAPQAINRRSQDHESCGFPLHWILHKGFSDNSLV